MPISPDREYRSTQQLEVREEADHRKIVTGYATTFGQEYPLWEEDGLRILESVDARAFESCDLTDVILQYDHQGRVYARTRNNTLRVEVDDHGLRIEADLGGTDIGLQLYQEISGGYTDRMSFGFSVAEDEKPYEEIDGIRVVHRRILRIGKLYDVSAVSIPANDYTAISARCLRDGEIARVAEECRVRAERERKQKIITIMNMTRR